MSVVGSPLPQLAVQVGDQERLTSYAGATGVGRYVYQLYFTYTVQEGDADADGVSIEANALRLNGATVVTSDGAALSTEHDALPFLWLRVDEVHGVDGVRPAVSSATVDGDSLTITFDEALDGGSAPAGSAFTVKGIGVDQSPTGVSISGAVVRLTLGAGAVHGHRVTVDYETPSSNPLRDAAGNAAASFTGQVMNDTADQPEPEVTGASVNGSTLTLTFDEALDTTAPPPASTFGVGGTAASTSVTAVGFERGDATKLELTVSPAVAHGDTGITVSYAKGANPLQDGEGNEVASFTRQPVTNDTPAPGVPPAVTGASVNGSTLTLTFDEALDTTAPPPASTFGVAGTDASTSVTAVGFERGDATKLELTLSPTVTHGDTGITVSYAKGTNPLRDRDGDEVASFTGQAVVNVTGAPAITGASVNGATLTMTFSESLDTTATPPASVFSVGGTDQSTTVAAAAFRSGDATKVELTLSPAVAHGDTGITVSYAKGADPLKDVDDNEVAGFTDHAVVNDTPDITAPTVAGASVNGATLTITFSEDLDTTAAPPTGNFTVGGTDQTTRVTAVAFKTGDATQVELTLSPAVARGDTGITVSYGRGANPLKDVDDNEVASFTGHAVTNDTPDTTVPTVSGASVNGAILTITFSEDLDTTAAPPPSTFTVRGAEQTTRVTAVGFKSGDATQVALTVSPAVEHGDTGITVSYAKGTNPLKDGDDNEVASFDDRPVANATPDTTAPTVLARRWSGRR